MKTSVRNPVLKIALALSCAFGIALGHLSASEISSNGASVLGVNPLLAEGAMALERGHMEEGLRLTLEGLKSTVDSREKAVGHSNACGGLAALGRWDEAIEQCNLALSIDPTNWRTYNNRAAGYAGKQAFDLALADLEMGLKLAPESRLLRQSLQVIQEHKRLARQRTRMAVDM